MKRLFKALDCFHALRVSNWLFYGGLPAAIPEYCPHCGEKL